MTTQILGERYEVKHQLGKKSGRRTLLALDLQTQELVVVKLLLFSNDFEWELLKLFEREAKTLKALSHSAIPRYLDFFELNSSHSKGFALVQTYIEGQSLEEHLKVGRTFTEAEVKQLAQELLEILIYLHSCQPPVIHRDIKPSNILLTNRSGNSVGQVYLVDFGSVQTLAAMEGGTITVVGTYGYMPPEQFGGRAVGATDLYSLGATLIYLVTGTHPADLPQKDGRIQFEQLTSLSLSFTHWLRRMTEPSLEKRFTSAQIALQALEQPQLEADSLLVVQKPVGSKIKLTKDNNRLEIVVSPQGRNAGTIFLSFFAIAWNSFIFFWTVAALSAPFPVNVPFALFSLPFWGAGFFLALQVFNALFGKLRLSLTQELIALTWELFGFKFQKPRPSNRQDITKLVYIPKHYTKDSQGDRVEIAPQLIIYAGVHKYQLDGTSGGITSEAELEWLAHELSDWLGLPITRE